MTTSRPAVHIAHAHRALAEGRLVTVDYGIRGVALPAGAAPAPLSHAYVLRVFRGEDGREPELQVAIDGDEALALKVNGARYHGVLEGARHTAEESFWTAVQATSVR